jgi:hypothetical protein
MKKILSVLFALVIVSAVFADNTTTTYANTENGVMKLDHSPLLPVLYLHTAGTGVARDTFAAGDNHIYGPYPLSSSSSSPMFAGFQDVADIITGTSPTMSLDFQVINSGALSDTSDAGWTASDTLNGTGTNQYQSLASFSGNHIVFRVHNYDNTACQIPKKLYIVFKESATYFFRR